MCAAIPRYCFTEHSVARAWYSGLDESTQAFITKDRDCWARIKTAMMRQWSLPLGLAVRNAEEQKKKDDETFLEFLYRNEFFAQRLLKPWRSLGSGVRSAGSRWMT